MTIFSRMTALAERDGRGQPRPGLPGRGRAGGDRRGGGRRRCARATTSTRRWPGCRPCVRRDRRAPAAALRPRGPEDVQVTFGATEALPPRCWASSSPATRCWRSTRATTATARSSRAPAASLRADRARAARLAAPGRAPSPRARVLLLNSPHNPTGRVLDRDELRAARRALPRARPDRDHRRGLRAPRLRRRARPAGDADPGADLTISSLGKTHSLTGWKTAGQSGPAELVARSATSSSSSPSPAARRSSTRPPRRSALPTPTPLRRGAARQARPPRRRPRGAGLRRPATPRAPTSCTPTPRPRRADAAELVLRLPREAGVAAIPLSPFTPSPRPAGALPALRLLQADEVLDDGDRATHSISRSFS